MEKYSAASMLVKNLKPWVAADENGLICEYNNEPKKGLPDRPSSEAAYWVAIDSHRCLGHLGQKVANWLDTLIHVPTLMKNFPSAAILYLKCVDGVVTWGWDKLSAAESGCSSPILNHKLKKPRTNPVADKLRKDIAGMDALIRSMKAKLGTMVES